LQHSGYFPDLSAQPGSVLLGLRLLTAAVPFVTLVVALGALRAYPLHGDRLAQIKKRVAELHQEKTARGVPIQKSKP